MGSTADTTPPPAAGSPGTATDIGRTGFDNGVIVLRGDELRLVAELLTDAADWTSTVRVAIDDGGLKLKRDELTWTPAIGRLEGV